MKSCSMKTVFSSQSNAIDNATLQEQLYSSSLLRLWRSGACTQIYEAEEDDEYFDVSYKFVFQLCLCTITFYNRKHCWKYKTENTH